MAEPTPLLRPPPAQWEKGEKSEEIRVSRKYETRGGKWKKCRVAEEGEHKGTVESRLGSRNCSV